MLKKELSILLTFMAIEYSLHIHMIETASNKEFKLGCSSESSLDRGNFAACKPKTSKGLSILPIRNRYNVVYTVEVGIGNPPQRFNMRLDTGSHMVWVPAIDCAQNIKAKRYNHRKSTTYENVDQRAEIFYLTNERMAGSWTYDDLWIGNKRIKRQLFARMSVIHEKGDLANYDGILGLDLSKMAFAESSHPIQNLLDQNLISEPIFSFYLKREAMNSLGGEMVLGGYNSKYFIGDVTFTKVIQNHLHQWRIKINNIFLESSNSEQGDSLLTLCDQGCEGVIDTGASLIFGPKAEVEELAAAVGAQWLEEGFHRISCDLTNLPTLVFTIESRKFFIKPDQYVTIEVDNCKLEVMGNSDIDFWILGDNFISAYYTIFDIGRRRIGFATAKH